MGTESLFDMAVAGKIYEARQIVENAMGGGIFGAPQRGAQLRSDQTLDGTTLAAGD